jgi:DNA-binding CsgD family transcriptional regulator
VTAWIAARTAEGYLMRRVANAGMSIGALNGVVQAIQRARGLFRVSEGGLVCSLQSAKSVFPALKTLSANGAHDLLAIVAHEGDTAIGVGALVGAGEQHPRLEPALHGRIVQHLRARLRLRASEQRQSGREPLRDELAACAAEPAARRSRDQLRLAAITAETVSSLQAERAWESFTLGQLHLFDSFDSVGRRFMLLRANEGEGPLPLVSPRQTRIVTMRAAGLSLKEIAHEMNVSIATVARELGSAMRALGLRHASELGV